MLVKITAEGLIGHSDVRMCFIRSGKSSTDVANQLKASDGRAVVDVSVHDYIMLDQESDYRGSFTVERICGQKAFGMICTLKEGHEAFGKLHKDEREIKYNSTWCCDGINECVPGCTAIPL